MKKISFEKALAITGFIIIFALISFWCCVPYMANYFSGARGDPREMEVMANIHTIQVALERYAVDSGGIYPLILYGGDWTDSFVTSQTHDYEDSSGNIQKGVSEYPGDVDVLIEFGYLSQYPRNPFAPRRGVETMQLLCTPSKYNLPQLEKRVSIWADIPMPIHGGPDRSKQLVDRQVGGEFNDLMWDVSEGQRHSPFPIVVVPEPDPNAPDNYYHYVNPTNPSNIKQKKFRNNHLFYQLPGNFYYYAVFSEAGGYTAFEKENPSLPIRSEPVGFCLVGYGKINNPGKDTYNIFGDYPYRSLGTSNAPEPLRENDDVQSMYSVYAGSDGRSDGVIIFVGGGQAAAGIEQKLLNQFPDK